MALLTVSTANAPPAPSLPPPAPPQKYREQERFGLRGEGGCTQATA